MTLQGFEIVAVADGSSALNEARRNRPDLILMDVNMPLKTGIDVCRELRADRSFRQVPIVLLTGMGDAREAGLQAGATAFLEKPFRPFALLDLVDRLVGFHIGALSAA